jgi:hypothetical protein
LHSEQEHTYRQLLRNELELLRRLSIARRSASTRLPILRRTGLIRLPTRSESTTIRAIASPDACDRNPSAPALKARR